MSKGVNKNFEMFNETKTSLNIDRLVFANMKSSVLKNEYNLNLIITEKKEIRRLNKIYRNTDKATDILSFPITDKDGEIFLCPEIIIREASRFDRNYENFTKFLFIHGLMHLKGFKHSSKMESEEIKIRNKFNV